MMDCLICLAVIQTSFDESDQYLGTRNQLCSHLPSVRLHKVGAAGFYVCLFIPVTLSLLWFTRSPPTQTPVHQNMCLPPQDQQRGTLNIPHRLSRSRTAPEEIQITSNSTKFLGVWNQKGSSRFFLCACVCVPATVGRPSAPPTKYVWLCPCSDLAALVKR